MCTAEATGPFLDPWDELLGLPVHPVPTGLIHATWQVGEPPVAAVQRVSPIFSPEIHHNIEAVGLRLLSRGLVTPRLIPTRDGGLWAVDAQGGIWRATTWVPGASLQRIDRPEQAASAAALVARWHGALDGLEQEHTFVGLRAGVHDTPAHLDALRVALNHAQADLIGELAFGVGQSILEHANSLSLHPTGPIVVAHGDLKINNIQFGASGEAIALLDLDTVGPQPLDNELGDAWRSWCNRAGEDQPEAELCLSTFQAAATAYLQMRPLPEEARKSLVPALERIALELAARFCRDAIEDCYFGWNPKVASSRRAHNYIRAKGQLSLARQAEGARIAFERILEVSRY